MSELELLDRVLASTSRGGDVYFGGELCGDWRVNASGSGHGAFDLVLRGSPWIHLPGDAGSRRQLHSGDFAFFARDLSHVLTNSEHALAATDTLMESVRPVGATDEETALICGKLTLEEHAQRFLLAPLPDMVVMPGRGEGTPKIVSGIVSIMWEEVRGQDQPLSVTLNKLADVLVAQVLRFTVSKRLVSSGALPGLAIRPLGRAMLEV